MVESFIKVLLVITASAFVTSVNARGGSGSGGGGEVFFWIVGVLVAFFVSGILGEKITPNGDKTLQIFIGFFTIVFALAIIGSLVR